MRESDKASKSAAADKNIPGTPSGS